MNEKILPEINNNITDSNIVSDNSKFTSPNEWNEFCSYLRKHNRYVLSNKWKRFIETVLFTAKKREHILMKGAVGIRARIGKDEEEEWTAPLPRKEIEAPPNEKAREGRINPRGISYLYLANDIKTAISEVRPWLKQSVTVGWFGLGRDLTVVDASKDKQDLTIFPEGKIWNPSTEWEPFIWTDINDSFSIPVNVGEEYIYYAPTQYLSECFKNAGYDGIIYKSSLTQDGYNIALFDPKVARLIMARLYDIESISYDFKECANSYRVDPKER